MTNNFILSLLTGNLDYKSAYGVEELALPIRGLLLPDEGAGLVVICNVSTTPIRCSRPVYCNLLSGRTAQPSSRCELD